MSSRGLASARSLDPLPLGCGGVTPACQAPGRQSNPLAHVQGDGDRGQGVAASGQCVVRGYHAGDEGQDRQGDRKHDWSAFWRTRRGDQDSIRPHLAAADPR